MTSGGGSAPILGRLERRLFSAAKQLGSEAAKRNCHCEAKNFKRIVKIFEYPLLQSHSIKREFVKLLSLTSCKISSLRGRESNCSSVTSYSCERGVNRHKNTDRATECAMTNVVKNLLKTTVGWACQPNNEIIARHSEDNNILSPKNLHKGIQEDFSLGAQDDESYCRSALLCRHETNFVSNSNSTPSPAFVAFAGAH